MTVVLDTSVLVAQVLPLPWAPAARRRFRHWIEAGEVLAVPDLALYEAVAVLRKYVAGAHLSQDRLRLTTERAREASAILHELGCDVHPPDTRLGQAALTWAETLGTWSAYDCYFLALAERLRAELWTADRKLYRSARASGVAWVQHVEDTS